MMIELFKNFVLTEKSVRLMEKYDQYTFDVDVKLTKPQIKKLSQDMFKVEVLSVNTHRPPRRKRRLGMSQGYKPSIKRVIIKVKKTSKPLTWKAEDE
jgi:large subunit ribosomal protein L23